MCLMVPDDLNHLDTEELIFSTFLRSDLTARSTENVRRCR